jgi:hypothetical protein
VCGEQICLSEEKLIRKRGEGQLDVEVILVIGDIDGDVWRTSLSGGGSLPQ